MNQGDQPAAPPARGDWTTLERQSLLALPPWLTVVREQVRVPSGRVIDDFYQVLMRDFVMIVPVDTDGRFVFVRGYKHGPRSMTLSPPGGLIEAAETPLAAGVRELREETGHAGGDWRPLGSYVVDANRHCGTMHLFLARDVRYEQAPMWDDTEPLEVVRLGRAEAVEALADGQLGCLAAAAAVTIALALMDAPGRPSSAETVR